MARGVKRTHCRICQKRFASDEPRTATGAHIECSQERFRENISDLRDHRGPWFDHWRRRSLASLGVIEIDEPVEAR